MVGKCILGGSGSFVVLHALSWLGLNSDSGSTGAAGVLTHHPHRVF